MWITTACVTSGVPQGSVLGAALFLVCINGIIANIYNELRLFADNILIYRPIHSESDHKMIWQLLWIGQKCGRWTLTYPKCSILQVTTNHTTKSFIYQMNGIPLRLVEKVKYFIVYLNNKLTWHDHIDYICNKANRLLGFLKRTLYSCHKHLHINNKYKGKLVILQSIGII